MNRGAERPMQNLMNRSETPAPDDDHGFTILEVLVTVIVLAILATVVVLSVRNTADNAADAAAATDAKVLDRAEESYRVLHGHYATEDELVRIRYIEEASTIHDIVIGPNGEYSLVRVDSVATTTAAATTSAPTTTTRVTTTTAAATTTAAPTTTTTPATTTTAAPATGVSCSFVVDSAWGSGGNGNLTITNNGSKALATWTVLIDRRGNNLTLWNAKVVGSDSSSVTVTNLSWNGAVPRRSTATPTGGSVSGSGIAVGLALPCTVIANPVTASKVSCAFVVTSAWGNGGNGELRITNDNAVALSSWEVRITRSGHTLDLWSADDEESDGKAFLTASNESHNGSVAAGATTVVTGGAVGGSPVTKGMILPCQVTDAS